MKRYGLLGEKLSHSYSPTIHNFIYEALRLDASYSLLECKEEDLGHYLKELKKGTYAGFNVTIPYKKKILSLLDEVDQKASKIGSVNTVYLRNGRTYGTNTDYDGFLETLKYYKLDVKDKDCYILGTGGASLAIYQVLKDLDANCFFVSRTPIQNQLSYQELADKKIDLLVNTTPVGMYPNVDASPVSSSIAKQANDVIDIIFNPQNTKLLIDAGSTKNGLYMLMLQAIRSEKIWQGKQIVISLEEMTKRLSFMMSLPKDIFSYVQQLKFKKNSIGWSEDEVYEFEDKYILKVSADKDRLSREMIRVDWLEDKIPGSKSILYREHNSKFYFLRTRIQGDSLISKRFLENPLKLIQTLKNVVGVLRKLDGMACPFSATDDKGSSFVHGDLCLPNIFVNSNDDFIGFIDLDNAGLGDPWYDYAWLIWSFEFNLRTKEYTELLLKELGLQWNEEKYNQYIPKEYQEILKESIIK